MILEVYLSPTTGEVIALRQRPTESTLEDVSDVSSAANAARALITRYGPAVVQTAGRYTVIPAAVASSESITAEERQHAAGVLANTSVWDTIRVVQSDAPPPLVAVAAGGVEQLAGRDAQPSPAAVAMPALIQQYVDP